jgi:hypothetical protein
MDIMRKLCVISLCLVALCCIILTLSACSAETAKSGQPAVPTATVTSTVTVISTVTVTPTGMVNPTNATTIFVTSSPTASVTNPGGSATVSQIEKNNNPKFFIGKDITYYNKERQQDGTIKTVPVFEDNMTDQQLGGFFSNKDATFVPRIPSITVIDEWFFRFDCSRFRTPWFINWGYNTKNAKSTATFTFDLYKKDDFDANYYKNPNSLKSTAIGLDKGVSDNGVHALAVNAGGSFVCVLRTSSSDEIQDWWAKFGGQ